VGIESSAALRRLAAAFAERTRVRALGATAPSVPKLAVRPSELHRELLAFDGDDHVLTVTDLGPVAAGSCRRWPRRGEHSGSGRPSSLPSSPIFDGDHLAPGHGALDVVLLLGGKRPPVLRVCRTGMLSTRDLASGFGARRGRRFGFPVQDALAFLSSFFIFTSKVPSVVRWKLGFFIDIAAEDEDRVLRIKVIGIRVYVRDLQALSLGLVQRRGGDGLGRSRSRDGWRGDGGSRLRGLLRRWQGPDSAGRLR